MVPGGSSSRATKPSYHQPRPPAVGPTPDLPVGPRGEHRRRMRSASAGGRRRTGALAWVALLGLLATACQASVENGAPGSDAARDDGATSADVRTPRDAGLPGDDAAFPPDTGEASDAGTPTDSGAPLDAGGGETDSGPAPIEPCAEIPGASFGTLSVSGPPSDRPPPEHADLNLELRGWTPVDHALGLVDISGPTDDLAPTLSTLFADDRVPAFVAGFAVHDWDWGCNCRASAITDPEVTLSAFGTAAGEVLEAPDSGYDIGDGYDLLVLYAADETVTLKYTREDNVVSGYTVHLHGVCVDPRLRALYEASARAGRGELPALRGQQPFARARGTSVLVAIRDTGRFMDPRSRKDWW